MFFDGTTSVGLCVDEVMGIFYSDVPKVLKKGCARAKC